MIPVSNKTLDTLALNTEENWQKAMANSFKSATELLSYLSIAPEELPYSVDFDSHFRMRIPQYFAELIDASNPFDPILLQALPLAEENSVIPGFIEDPLEEADYAPTAGVIHKYHNRVLLIAHQACAIHCRYCFRRHFPYSKQALRGEALESALSYIAAKKEVTEVILSGGDPLSLSDSQLFEILKRIDALPNIKTIRIHSRTPVVLPNRITTELARHISQLQSQIVFVIHCNHPNEITAKLGKSLNQLRTSGVHLLNQSVLLKGINDNAQTLITLSNKLFDIGVLPYYLHSLDPVKGTHHFAVSDSAANELWLSMQKEISGYLLPRLVREIPAKASKTWINS